jgi:tetratricopeptide (TPR) repeat protein
MRQRGLRSTAIRTARAVGLLIVLASVGACGNPSKNPIRLGTIAAVYEGGDVQGAVQQLTAYLGQYPRDDLAWTILGHAHEDLDQDDEARTAYDRALAINPRRFEAINGLGILHRKRGDDDAAMDAYRRALAIEPGYAQAYSSMTVVALRLHRDAEALEYARKGYELDKTDPATAANLAVAYHYNGDAANRDRLTKIAGQLGYRKGDRLRQIYDGTLTVRK